MKPARPRSRTSWPTSTTTSPPLISGKAFLGRLGRVIEPAVRPLGWDWRIGSAVMASFPAEKSSSACLGVIYNLGTKLDPGEEADQGRLVGQNPRGHMGRHRRAGL